jgi:hypothetical protein
MIVERTVRPRHVFERLEGCVEGGRQRLEVGLFRNRIGGDQDSVGAKTDRLRPAFRGSKDAARQQAAQARDFRAEARRRGARQTLPYPAGDYTREFSKAAVTYFNALNCRPNADIERHRRPPKIQK